MSMSDSTKLSDDLVANITLQLSTPMVRVELTDTGRVMLYVGGLVMVMKPQAAAELAASLATVASTALVNQALKLVRDEA